ncbi:MAG: hypothetical protein Q4E74_05450 [Ruminococcus sp.]|nr:hypothetical protein [Ruminococcus sp.]
MTVRTIRTEENNRKDGYYKGGFFAFLCGTALMGVLLGTISFCLSEGDFLKGLGLAQADFIQSRKAMDYAQIMVSSFSGATAFLAAAFICGLCAVGQPLGLCILLVRGMGLGLTLAQLYSAYGKSGMLYSAGLVLPGAAVSTLALVFAVREAVSLSNIYLRISLSGRQENGLLDTVRLYGAKFLVLISALAASAGIDCLCNFLFIRYF